MDFCKQFNAKTQKEGDTIIPVVISIYSDRSFTFITKTPPASVLIRKALKLEKGSAEPNRNKVGRLSKTQVTEIAKMKMPDLNCYDVVAAESIIRGTARSMGVEVEA